jgi:creatinine amidohydrolase
VGGVHRLEELRPAELERRLRERPGLVLPLGTIEWHSYHLPLGLDGIKASEISAAVAEKSGAVLAPTSWWAAGGVPFPYTLQLSGEVVEALLKDVLVQFAAMGFRALMVVNGHYGLENSIAVRRAALWCMRQVPCTVLPVAEYEVLIDLGARGDHAGVFETSLLWAGRPDLVRLDAVDSGEELPGIVGEDPRGKATRDLGVRALEEAASSMSASLERALAEGALDRERFAGALAVGLKALEALASMRASRPRSEVPPVVTPEWLQHLKALNSGRYEDAKRHAERKLSDPTT